MAICKYGPLVSEVRGSIGGTTFTAGHFGFVVRQRRHPVHTPTNRRSQYKAWLAMTVARWTDVLDQGQRDAWDLLGKNTDFENSLDQTYHPTGINLYCRTNILSLHVRNGLPFIDLAPDNAIGAHYPITLTSDDVDTIEAEMIDEPAAPHNVYFWLGLPQRPSVKYYSGPWQAWEYQGDVALHAGAVELWDEKTLQPDARYFIRDRSVYSTGEISAAYIQSVLLTGV